ncbi:FAD-dependent monooxygenase [Dactylosporangium darangshiense]|uniref:FAD-dependent monooxygenase n=1 Tax=Dactylosporangium darangshiense TaxID=579108 RepID=UPI00363BFF20
MDILISGASVAGPSLALWLQRYGHHVTVVEKAPALRGGGYAVDFRGRVHMETLGRMGLRDSLEARATHMGDIAIVDAAGTQVAALPSAIFSGDLEVLRGISPTCSTRRRGSTCDIASATRSRRSPRTSAAWT